MLHIQLSELNFNWKWFFIRHCYPKAKGDARYLIYEERSNLTNLIIADGILKKKKIPLESTNEEYTTELDGEENLEMLLIWFF